MRTIPANQTFDEAVFTPEEERPGISLRNIAHILYRRKWLILVVFLCSAATAVTFIRHTAGKPLFLATSQILVSPAREQVIDPAVKTGGSAPPWEGFNAVGQTAWVREILTGRFLAERVVKAIGPDVLYPKQEQDERNPWNVIRGFLGMEQARHDVPVDDKIVLEEAVDAFLQNVSANQAGKSSIINLSFTHHDAEIAAKAVNLLGEMYLERHLGVQKNPKADSFFREQFQILKEKLDGAEQALQAFKQRHGVTTSVKQEQELLLKQQSELRRELTQARSHQAEVQSRDAELRSQLANTSRNPATIGQLRERLTALEIREGELALRFTAQNPELRAARDQIRQLREKVRELEGANLYGAESSQESLYARLQGQVLTNAAEARALKAREDTLTAKLAELETRLGVLDRADADYSRLEKQLEMEESSYRLYLTKFEESRISGAMDEEKIASVRVIEAASVPVKPLSSKRRTKILIGLVACAIGALALPFLLQLFGGSLDTAEDVERSLNLPVLASIPRLVAK